MSDAVPLEENLDAVDRDGSVLDLSAQGLGRSPETIVGEIQDAKRLEALINQLPAAYREVIILREMEDLSYREIAGISGEPIGTVMSRLARARQLLQKGLHNSRGWRGSY